VEGKKKIHFKTWCNEAKGVRQGGSGREGGRESRAISECTSYWCKVEVISRGEKKQNRTIAIKLGSLTWCSQYNNDVINCTFDFIVA